MRHTEWTHALGVEHPVIQAPLGGIPSEDLVAAVSNAGGLGSLGAAYLTPEQITASVARIRSLTPKPFSVSLFAEGSRSPASQDPRRMLEILAPIHARLGLPPPSAPAVPADRFAEQLEAVLEARPTSFSFTFGIPPSSALERVRARGIAIWGTATTVEEARLLEEAGVDAVVAQGMEAGGHRGTFAGLFEASLMATMELVPAIAASVELPVIVAGGLMDGEDVAQGLARGAVAAQLGTAFLACPECGAPQAYKNALLATRVDTTVLTRAFSGKAARGLANEFTSLVAREEEAILDFPLQNALTRPMRTAAAQRGEAGLLSLWAGQGVARIRALPAAELVRRLVAEMEASPAFSP